MKEIAFIQDDLLSTKQAISDMLIAGIDVEKILHLDSEGFFGNLDTLEVLREEGIGL